MVTFAISYAIMKDCTLKGNLLTWCQKVSPCSSAHGSVITDRYLPASLHIIEMPFEAAIHNFVRKWIESPPVSIHDTDHPSSSVTANDTGLSGVTKPGEVHRIFSTVIYPDFEIRYGARLEVGHYIHETRLY